MAGKLTLTVSQLCEYIRRMLQLDPMLHGVELKGEISNLKFHQTGTIFFTLKDENAAINCVMYASDAARLQAAPFEGMRAIVTGSDVQRKKPAPDIFLKAAEKAGIDPKNCAVAEDSIAGIQAAKAAGMLALAVTTTFDREALENAGADYVTDNFTVLPDIIKKNMN